jgi:methionyl-tRNA formyltransferase
LKKLRVVFLGTPQFAVPSLKALIAHPDVEIAGVVCPPDRLAGRGNKIQVSPVKELATLHHLPILQPDNLAKSPESVEVIRQWVPDLIVVAAFGQILKKAVLELPPKRVINVHPSLLPAYRGAAPINWAVIKGDTESGVTIMYTEAGVDTGPILRQRTVKIGPNQTAQELGHELSIVGADLLIETLEQIQAETVVPKPQDNDKATYAPMLSKELGNIDWSKSAGQIHNLVRGLIPWPGTHTTFRGSLIKILSTNLVHEQAAILNAVPDQPGTILTGIKELYVKCGTRGEELLEIVSLQPASKTRMSGSDWIRGARLFAQKSEEHKERFGS